MQDPPLEVVLKKPSAKLKLLNLFKTDLLECFTLCSFKQIIFILLHVPFKINSS